MLKPDWLNEVTDVIPMIQEVALSCDEPFREKCFELLLLKALKISKSSDEGALPQQTEEQQLDRQPSQYHLQYQKFLADNNLSHEMIENLIDFESGKIYITRKLGNVKSQGQRIVACLLAIRYAAIEGEFKIPSEELRQQCESLSLNTGNNFRRDMRNTNYNGSIVFDDKGDLWKVTIPGMGFVASIIRGLIDTKQA